MLSILNVSSTVHFVNLTNDILSNDAAVILTDIQCKMPEFERYFLHVFAIILYECITKDKVSLVPLWLHIMKNLKVIEEQPNSFSMWQIKLVSSQISKILNSADKANPLLGVESMLAIKQKTTIILDKWEHGTHHLLTYYVLINNFVVNETLYFLRFEAFIQTVLDQWNCTSR